MAAQVEAVGEPMSHRQRGLMMLALPPAIAGVLLTVTVVTTGRPPSGLPSWLIVALAYLPAFAMMLRYQLRTRDSFPVATVLTTAGTVLAGAVSYASIWVGALLSLWAWAVMTDSTVRASSVALTSGVGLLLTVAAAAWQKLK